MTLHEVPQNELFKLKVFFDEIIKEQKARITGAEAIVKLDRAYTAKHATCFVDNVNNPDHILILSHCPGILHSGFLCTEILRYSRPEKRSKEASDKMFMKSEEYARKHQCEQLTGSSWKYKGSRETDLLWIEKGFEIQETSFIKFLE